MNLTEIKPSAHAKDRFKQRAGVAHAEADSEFYRALARAKKMRFKQHPRAVKSAMRHAHYTEFYHDPESDMVFIVEEVKHLRVATSYRNELRQGRDWDYAKEG